MSEMPNSQGRPDGSSTGRPPKFTAAPITFELGDGRIGGILYTPAGMPPFPLVICSHGFTGTHENLTRTCEMLAEGGVAALSFDFRNGKGSMSSGDFLKMSVRTEVLDLSLLLASMQEHPGMDAGRIVLLGHSQGGLVSALAAAACPDQVAGLILAYPAFSIPDQVRRIFADPDALPDTYNIYGATVGRVFAADIWDLDVFAEIAGYTKPVLLMHGTEDAIVSISCSERAAAVYEKVQFLPFAGAGHGFRGETEQKSFAAIQTYLKEIGIIRQ